MAGTVSTSSDRRHYSHAHDRISGGFITLPPHNGMSAEEIARFAGRSGTHVTETAPRIRPVPARPPELVVRQPVGRKRKQALA